MKHTSYLTAPAEWGVHDVAWGVAYSGLREVDEPDWISVKSESGSVRLMNDNQGAFGLGPGGVFSVEVWASYLERKWHRGASRKELESIAADVAVKEGVSFEKALAVAVEADLEMTADHSLRPEGQRTLVGLSSSEEDPWMHLAVLSRYVASDFKRWSRGFFHIDGQEGWHPVDGLLGRREVPYIMGVDMSTMNRNLRDADEVLHDYYQRGMKS